MSYYRRRLPHWRPDSAALFITWRLHGSLPADRGGRASADEPVDKIDTPGRRFAQVDRRLDYAGAGPLWLKDPRLADLIVSSLRYGESELQLYVLRAWVVMANHVHVLLFPNTTAARITRSLKTYTARQANILLNRQGQRFWQEESYDHWVRDSSELERIVFYIESNPVKAGLVCRAEDWPWSSANRQ